MRQSALVMVLLFIFAFCSSLFANIERSTMPKRDMLRARSIHDEELRLLYITFVYAQDLQNGIKVAQIALRRYPNSIYWNEKMAEVLQWSGRGDAAMEYMRRLYALTHQESVARKIVEYDLAAYHYEDALKLVEIRYKKRHDPKDLELLLFLYNKVAEPDKAADLLYARYKETGEKRYLVRALRTALYMGDMNRAADYATILQHLRPYTYEQALLLANYFYLQRDLRRAYAMLQDAKGAAGKDPNYLEYLYTKSDLGWFFQDLKNATDASMQAIEMQKGRQVDYERALYYYSGKKDEKMVMMLAREGYERYGLGYLFFTYAQNALKERRYKELAHYMQEVEQKDRKLAGEAMFLYLRYEILSALGEKRQARLVLERLLRMKKSSSTLKMMILASLQDRKRALLLKEVLMLLRQKGVQSEIYFPMASAYLFFGDVDAANYYADLLVRNNNAITNTPEFLFLQANIYQAQGREELFRKTIRTIYAQMREQMRQTPAFAQDPLFVATYLRAAMYVEPADRFEEELKSAQHILKRETYEEIAYSFASKKGAREEAHEIAARNKEKTLWIAFGDALWMYESQKVEKTLYRYLEAIAKNDAIEGANISNQQALAQSLAYEYYLLHNRRAERGRLLFLDLAKKRSDSFESKAAWYRRENLQANYLRVRNENYIAKGWFLEEGVRVSPSPSSLNDADLYNLPSSLLHLYAGVKKNLDRGSLRLRALYHDKMASYMGLEATLFYDLRRDLSLKIEAAFGKEALETSALLVGGKKDSVLLQAVFKPMPSTSLELYGEASRFASDDDVDLGSGLYYRAAFMHTYHSGYPDIEFGAQFEGGRYSQKSGTHGVIDSIQPKNYEVLPQNYISFGPSISFGMQKRHLYTRAWRPYFQGGVFYNTETNDFNYALEAGAGGRLFRADHLSVGASYSEFVRGVNDKVLEFYLDYEFLY